MKNLINTNKYYKPKQLKLPLEIEKIIEISDPVYSFCEIVDCIDFNRYLSLRRIEKSCKTDIRYMFLLEDMKATTFATIGNFIREDLTDTIENIFVSINKVIFEKENVDLNHTYIEEILKEYKNQLNIDESTFKRKQLWKNRRSI